jgi:hypothetical protein
MPRITTSVKKPTEDAIVTLALEEKRSVSAMAAKLLDEALSRRTLPATGTPSDGTSRPRVSA